MIIHHGLRAILSEPVALAIGNFDGMHLGHHALLTHLTQWARVQQLASAVVFFEPQPQEFFSPHNASGRLMRCRDKLAALQAYGIDHVVVLPFNARLSQLSAQDFLQHFLLKQLRMKALLVGQDFRFGYQRQGDVAFLAEQSSENFALEIAKDYAPNGERVSSTLVRESLLQRDLLRASRYLGRAFSIKGRVAHGQKLGQGLGFPTINIPLHRLQPPLMGIYAVTVRGLGRQAVQGVASCGYRPVVKGTMCLLEVFCFDFNETVYGARVEVCFHHFIREEANYPSLNALKAQIAKDVEAAKQYFKREK